MGTKTNLDLSELRRISSSDAMLRLTDSILGLDRDVVSGIITTYLYFKSQGKTDGEFFAFYATKRMGTSVDIGFKILPPLASGFLSDRAFRSLILGAVRSFIRKSSG